MAYQFTVTDGTAYMGSTTAADSYTNAVHALRKLVLELDTFVDMVVESGQNVADFCPLTFLADFGLQVTFKSTAQ